MLCTLKVRRSPAVDEEDLPYQLKIQSKQAMGGAGGLISDEVRYPTLPSLLLALHELHIPAGLLESSEALSALEDAVDRWIPIATGVQITFGALAAAGFDLDDDSE